VAIASWEEGRWIFTILIQVAGMPLFFIFSGNADHTLVECRRYVRNPPRNFFRQKNAAQNADNSKSAPQWIVDLYITIFFRKNHTVPAWINGLITHFHDVHLGKWDVRKEKTSKGTMP